MYGVIHFVVKDMIVSQFGQEALDQILSVAGLEESQHFKLFYPYDDHVLEALLKATSKCLGLPVEMVLEVFGDYFITFSLRHGYDDMLRTLGCDMTSFIQNLDSLHSLLALSYDNMVAPSFRCETVEEGRLVLHYHSTRTGYYPLVKGLLSAVAREIFNQKIDILFVSSDRALVGQGCDQEHVIFHVIVPQIIENNLVTSESLDNDRVKASPSSESSDVMFEPVLLNKDQFATAFPYHLIFDKDLRLRQYGRSVARFSPVPLREGILVTSAFTITYPRISFTVENICRFINAIFILTVIPQGNTRDIQNPFSMKGQMIWLQDTRQVIFVGSPRLTSLKEMKRMNIYMADVPLYDVTREMVLLYQQRTAEIDITKELDETTAELKRMSRELELEKQRTEKLLYQMLPEKVAIQLKNGKAVEAEKFDQVTVLFSDIVNFTTIAAACTPLEIVNLLNELYHRFDLITNKHSVYKVETIGDAYMVVSGVPDKTDQHALKVADFALDMVSQTVGVLCPDTKRPLQIRVGLHTGPVVAGVVGLKMPRYCLFGDTVNTASRMESNSVPGRIHVSETTFSAIKDNGYLCRCRGEVNIKGKGVMKTYFLIGSCHNPLPEPQDEHVKLTLVIPESNELIRELTHKYGQQTNGYLVGLHSPTISSNNNLKGNETSSLPTDKCLAAGQTTKTDKTSVSDTNVSSSSKTPSSLTPINQTVSRNKPLTIDSLSKSISHPLTIDSLSKSISHPLTIDSLSKSISHPISTSHIIKGAHLCWGVSSAADGGVKRNSQVTVMNLEEPNRFEASIKDRRINDYDKKKSYDVIMEKKK